MDVARVAARVALAVAVVTVGAVWIGTSGTDAAHGGDGHASPSAAAAASPGATASAHAGSSHTADGCQ